MNLACHKCNSGKTKKNGHAKNNKQQYHCNECGAGFVKDPKRNNNLSKKELETIERALLERNSLRGICRIFGISLTWLLTFAVDLYKKVPADLAAMINGGIEFDIEVITEADELWSFVGNKENKAWIWIIIHRASRQVIAFHVGGRGKRDAKKLWNKIPITLRDKMFVYTDFLKSYACVIPSKQHKASGKDAGETNHIERLNCTIRQRVSRLVREALSFSKKWANHVGAIGYFLFNYNKERQLIMQS